MDWENNTFLLDIGNKDGQSVVGKADRCLHPGRADVIDSLGGGMLHRFSDA